MSAAFAAAKAGDILRYEQETGYSFDEMMQCGGDDQLDEFEAFTGFSYASVRSSPDYLVIISEYLDDFARERKYMAAGEAAFLHEWWAERR